MLCALGGDYSEHAVEVGIADMENKEDIPLGSSYPIGQGGNGLAGQRGVFPAATLAESCTHQVPVGEVNRPDIFVIRSRVGSCMITSTSSWWCLRRPPPAAACSEGCEES